MCFFILVDNELHCDFVKLREMLIRTNMEDMREKTHTRHYELYRQKRLEQMGFTDVDSDNKPVSVYKHVIFLYIELIQIDMFTRHYHHLICLFVFLLLFFFAAGQVSFQQTFEAKRSNHLAELQSKEDEMRQMFVLRVKEKEAELKDSEKEVSLYMAHTHTHTHSMCTK